MAAKSKLTVLSREKPIKSTCKTTGTETQYASLTAAGILGFDIGKISMCCNGKRGSHKGFLWEYLPTASKREQLLEQTQYPITIIAISEDLKLGTFVCPACGNAYTASIDMVRQGFTAVCEECKCNSYTYYRKDFPHLYSIYQNMKTRCYNPKSPSFVEYGAKGIAICTEWLDSFENFKQWSLANGYTIDLSIDRIDNSKGYTPKNCRWTTKNIQAQNTRRIMITNTSTYRGVSLHSSGSWQAEIRDNGKRHYLGLYPTAYDAAWAYDSYVIEHSTEHTRNFTGPETVLQQILEE